jgi:hypothetical protein
MAYSRKVGGIVISSESPNQLLALNETILLITGY